MTTVGSCSTTVLTRVCTWTEVDVIPIGNTTDVGGVTMSPEPAVPPDVRLTVVSLVGAVEAVITKVAGAPCATSSSTDWMVSTGVVVRGAMAGRNAVKVPWTTPLELDLDVWAAGGP